MRALILKPWSNGQGFDATWRGRKFTLGRLPEYQGGGWIAYNATHCGRGATYLLALADIKREVQS